MLTTAGGLVFTGYMDGTVVAYDDTSLDVLWKLMSARLQRPADVLRSRWQQYVAILSGLSRISMGRLQLTPELRDMRNQTVLLVFGL